MDPAVEPVERWETYEPYPNITRHRVIPGLRIEIDISIYYYKPETRRCNESDSISAMLHCQARTSHAFQQLRRDFFLKKRKLLSRWKNLLAQITNSITS